MRTIAGFGSTSVFSATLLLGLSQPFAQTALSVLRINCSGPAFTDAQGIAWAEDAYYTAGNFYTGDEIVTAGDYPALYQDVRWNDPTQPEPMQYSIPVTAGNYTVRLHFSEVWSGAYFEGGRVFNVSINGAPVLENLDIFKEVGSLTPLVKAFEVAALDGKVDIVFTNVVQNAAIAGIEIVPSGGTGLDPARRMTAGPASDFLRVRASLSGRLAVAAPAGAGAVRLLDLQGRRVAARALLQGGRAVFEGLRPGMYFAVAGR